jgi:hypothetical protein
MDRAESPIRQTRSMCSAGSICESYDDKGNVVGCGYELEDSEGAWSQFRWF